MANSLKWNYRQDYEEALSRAGALAFTAAYFWTRGDTVALDPEVYDNLSDKWRNHPRILRRDGSQVQDRLW